MDILSHGLWAAVPFYRPSLSEAKQLMHLHRKKRKTFWIAFLFGVLPDLVAFIPHTLLMIFGQERHPLFTRMPIDLINPVTFNLYNVTHSFVIFAAVFALAFFLNKKKPYWLMWGWGLHILSDIPTHSIKFFATPFLWPFSDFRVNGVPWSNPRFLIWNYALLIIVYITLTRLRRKPKLVPQEKELNLTS